MTRKNTIRAIMALTLVLTLALAGCGAGGTSPEGGEAKPNNGGGQSVPEEDKASAAMAAYAAVLRGEAGFFSVDIGEELTVSQLSRAISDDSSVAAEATRFALVDLDGDGETEVILWLAVNSADNTAFEILRYNNETVYGCTMLYRSFMELKADGTFSFSSGAADSGFGTLAFTDNACTVDMITYSESSFDSDNKMTVAYFVDHAEATEEQFSSAVERQSAKESAAWYDFSDDNIAAELAAGK